ncbi:MAG: mechanosensitive ion channel, partial [Janthinobacterium sp.]
AVLLSGVGRAIVVLLALMLLLAPFGEGPGELFQRVGKLQDGLAIGEVAIRPGALIQALLVLLVGFVALGLFKRWLQNSYLPTTNLDSGMQVSFITLFGYIGGVLAVALALSAAGIGLERIAWVASALSVGIGFGLQAVVQNFVSGLILLAERPVKVGDWVSLGGVEGDIRRINVRATEIQLGDRSTVIVPNSEFITKTVRNVTLANPLGLVQVKLPLPLGTDAQAARALILSAFVDNPDVLDTPAPSVQLDGIDNGLLLFNATGYASSPRLTSGIRSALLFELLKRLDDAHIAIAKPSTMVLSTVPAQPETPAILAVAPAPPPVPPLTS